MDPAGSSSHTENMDFLAPYIAEDLGRRPGESLIRIQDAIVFSGDYTDAGCAFSSQTSLGLRGPDVGSGLLANLEEAAEGWETSLGESASVSAPRGAEPSCTEANTLDSETSTGKYPSPPREAARPEKGQDEGKDNAAQALIWAGILQAQLCMLDLQGELEKQEEPVDEQSSCDLAISQQLLDESDSDDGHEDRPEEEEEESLSSEEEEQGFFYDNPLFQESPHSGGLNPTEGPAFWNDADRDSTGSANEAEGVPEDKPASGSKPEEEVLCPLASVASEDAGGFPVDLDPGTEDEAMELAVPTYTMHHSAWTPLVITEGDIDGASSGTRNTEALGCPPDQPAVGALCHSLFLQESGLSGTVDQPEDGLLFSASSTFMVTALLQEQDCMHPSASEVQPLSPSPDGGIWSPQVSLNHTTEPAWCQEGDLGLASPGCGSPPPPCTWAEASRSTSCLQGEVTESDSPHDLLDAVEGKQPGSTVEEPEMEEIPPVPGDEPPLQEESTDPTQGCPAEEDTEKKPGDSDVAPLDGAILANGASGDQGAAQRLAARLYRLDGFKRSQVASYLRKNNEFSRLVAEQYLTFFQFSGQTLDRALRSFLKAFVLTGETQERERILGHFSNRYYLSNPDAFPSSDAVHTLTCALMLLNTDLHGQNIGRSMTCSEFVANLDGMMDGENFPKDQLKALYNSIRSEKLEWAMDEEELDSAPMLRMPSTPSSRKKSNPFLSLTCDPNAATYKQGLLTRKVHAEADGKKTPWGKRGWKTFHTVLKGVVLYFLKDESRPEAPGGEEVIGVHHALAERASKYNKRPNVFCLQTADWRIFLFQAQNAEEMNSWISRINLVAAMFSSPPFPAAVGSQRKFIRPILPTAPCRSSLEEQHQAHESWMDKFSDELSDHQRNLPDKRGRGRDLEEYRLKRDYLVYEKRRYETYVRLLEARLHNSSETLEQWEVRLGAQDLADEGPSLTKSHSSPSLNLDLPPTGIKVKRNISERRTVRKIIPKRNKHLL
uniref:Pleckstrin and Sec7 domain containing 4 n=1 Tax=Pelusios castaneus TaxID=367368 RepID=A0A8C8S959_9SAUR